MLNKVPLEIYDMICFFLPDLENLYNISHIRKCSDYFIKRILSCLHQLKKEKTFPNFPSDTFTQLMLLERLYNYNNNLNLSKYNLDKSDRYLTNIEDSFTPFHFFKYHDIEDASSHHPFRLFKE